MSEVVTKVEDEPYIWGNVLSLDPLVTISATNLRCPLGLMSIARDMIGDRPGLHLLSHTWTLEQGHARPITQAMLAEEKLNPESRFVMMASNDLEIVALAAHGATGILGNGVLLTDERIWFPREQSSGTAMYDAVYVSRLDALKRHYLAAGIDSLLLLYGYALDKDGDTALERVRRVLPHATFGNNDFNQGQYRNYAHDELARLLARARVGLCLSAVEGSMRASMEYMLCGLPVVSTRSVGGRDRYYGTGYCRVVARDDPDQIAAAVRELAALNLDRERIRQHVLQVLAFERHNFLLAVNGLVREHFQVDHDLFRSITPFLGMAERHRPASEVRRIVSTQLQAGVAS